MAEETPAFGNYTKKSFVYGKYFEPSADPREGNDYSAQTYYIFSPAHIPVGTKLPVIIQIHGGGFTGGAPFSEITQEIAAYLDNGFHFVSVGYRLVATKYYYAVANGGNVTDTSGNLEEEYIWAGPATPPHAAVSAPDGFLQLDTGGPLGGGPMYLSDYRVHAGRTEFNTKCSFDAAQALEHLIMHADQLQVDVHRIVTTGGSAGGGEIHYLTWVYHGFPGNAARYTPRGMVYTMAQLDYPVQNMLDKVWAHWADSLGAQTPLSTILQYSDCGMIVGNPWCEGADYARAPWLCNSTWHRDSMARYCDTRAAFERATLGDLVRTQVFPQVSAQDRGIGTLWYNTVNMQRHAPKPFYLYIANWLNSTAGMNVVHNALYAKLFGDFATKAGVNFTTYYTDWHGMKPADRGTARYTTQFQGEPRVFNYRSNFDWASVAGVGQRVPAASQAEQLLFACHAVGKSGCASPPPSPPPSPGAPVSAPCKLAIATTCKATAPMGCDECVRAHAQGFMGAGCPPASDDGFARCVAFCRTL